MIGAAIIFGVAASSGNQTTLDCRIWPSENEEITSQSPIAPPESVAYLNNEGSIRISFANVGDDLRDVRVFTLSDPMALDQRKRIRWSASTIGGGRVHLMVPSQSKDNFRWIILDPLPNGKFNARWRFSERLGSRVIFLGSGFGECSPKESGEARQ